MANGTSCCQLLWCNNLFCELFLDLISCLFSDMNGFEIGIIGFGDMGQLYGRCFARAGFRVNACDVPDNYSKLNLWLDSCLETHFYLRL